MTRVANFAQHERMLSMIMQSQTRLHDAQIQIGSGAKAQVYAGIARDAERLVNMKNAHLQTGQYITNNKDALRRLERTEQAVADIFDVAGSFRTLLVNGLNGDNAADLNMAGQARQMLEQVAGLLNTRDDGRYLFAGTRTDTRPVELDGLPVGFAIPTEDGDSLGYYAGNASRMNVRADTGLDVTYGVTADEAPFEQLVRALHVVATGVPEDRERLEHALEVANQALHALPDLRTRVGGAMATLEQVNRGHEEFRLFAERIIGELEDVDIAEAVTRMNAAQVSLEASFMTLARIAQSSLLNYLR